MLGPCVRGAGFSMAKPAPNLAAASKGWYRVPEPVGFSFAPEWAWVPSSCKKVWRPSVRSHGPQTSLRPWQP
eukprot:828087-Amphidinium_carterae.1